MAIYFPPTVSDLGFQHSQGAHFSLAGLSNLGQLRGRRESPPLRRNFDKHSAAVSGGAGGTGGAIRDGGAGAAGGTGGAAGTTGAAAGVRTPAIRDLYGIYTGSIRDHIRDHIRDVFLATYCEFSHKKKNTTYLFYFHTESSQYAAKNTSRI